MESLIFRTFLMVWFVTSSGARRESEETALFHSLLVNTTYDTQIKPTIKAHEQIVVTVQFGLGRVESLDEKRQEMNSLGWIFASWRDELLQWDPIATQIERIVVPAHNIWLPEIAMVNSVDDPSDLSMNSNFRALIQSNGMVTWGPGFRWHTTCIVDLTYFPFDRQTCEVQFMNWMYTADLLNYTVMSSYVVDDVYERNGEWDLVAVEQYTRVVTAKLYPGIEYPQFIMRVTLQRVPMYFIMNVILPCILMTFLSAMVYLVPYESGEKVSLGITVFLSFSIVLLIISDVTPRNGNSLPVLSWYVVGTMMMSGTSVVLTIVVLNIYHHCPSMPVPAWVDRVVLDILARMLCMHASIQTSRSFLRLPDDVIIGDVISENPKKTRKEQKYNPVPPDVLNYVRQLVEKDKQRDAMHTNTYMWVLVGRVIDRFFLLLSFVFIFVTAAVMFPILSSG